MAGANTLHFTDDNFENEVLGSQVPVLVDFWAEWCGPCQILGPTIDELATEYAGKAKVGKVDVDKAQQVAMRFGIQNIPTVVLFENGEPVERIVGARGQPLGPRRGHTTADAAPRHMAGARRLALTGAGGVRPTRSPSLPRRRHR